LFFPRPPLYNSGDRHERIDGERFATPAKPVTNQLKISHRIFGRSSRSTNAANRWRLEISRNPYRGGADFFASARTGCVSTSNRTRHKLKERLFQ
jgi:hypothetical protein